MKYQHLRIAVFCCLVGLLSSCALFRKSEKSAREVPPPEKSQPLPPEKTNEKKTLPPPFNVPAFAKVVHKPVYNVALFAPLYVDNVVDTSFSENSTQPLPANVLPGLELYEGVRMALDSLRSEGIALRLYVYDTKSSSKPLNNILQNGQLDSADLILGAVSSDELTQLSNYAKQKEINFVSVTYPNDGGIKDNPFLTIVNSTLRTHCYAIQDFAQQKFTNQQILVLRQNTAQGKRNAEYIQQAYQHMQFARKVPIEIIDWDENATAQQIATHLSTAKNNVVIVTALYSNVAEDVIRKLATLGSTYAINVIGMPTLDGQNVLLQPDFKGVNIYYSTPYFNSGNEASSRSFILSFFHQYRARPSDMAFKGFEAMYYFAHLLHDGGVYFNRNMNDRSGNFINAYNFQPVYGEEDAQSDQSVPDYFENKHLYFVQVRDSVISRAN